MQGLPTNLLTQATVAKAGKTESPSSGAVVKDGKVVGESNSKNAFAELLSGLFGSSETKEGSSEKSSEESTDLVKLISAKKNEKGTSAENENAVNLEAGLVPALPSAENKMDLFLKNKELEQKGKSEVVTLTKDQALSTDVLSKVQKLLETKSPQEIGKSENQLNQKISSASDNLAALLNSLKGEEASGPNEEGASEPTSQKNQNPLDFLLKQSKGPAVTEAGSKTSIEKNPTVDFSSKLGLSSEEFISQLKEGNKDSIKDSKVSGLDKNELATNEFDPKALLSKQMNQSMKSYGQKQDMLGDGIIKNTKDLAFKENKIKGASAAIDELKNPDLKVSNELSHIKESFIPQMQKSDSSQNGETNTNLKVLDLSKINSSNTTEIIKRISDYVQQSQVANKDSLDLTVKHDSLGQFKIQVNKPMGGGNLPMDVQITTTTAEGHDFFMRNEIGLMKNLSQAGIQLSDLRIVSSGEAMSFSQNDSKNSNNSQFGQQVQKEFMSFESGDSRNGSERRRELWQEARANQQRFGA